MKRQRDASLIVVSIFSVLAVWLADGSFLTREEHPAAGAMREAASRAAEWSDIVRSAKTEDGLINRDPLPQGEDALLGEEQTAITTTLGSLEAKRTSLNPHFAALIVRLLAEAGVDSPKTVGIMVSGSFPALGISALAAVRTIGAAPVLLSSLGASSYGANQTSATWIDVERWLRAGGVTDARSVLVTYGAEGDSGGGLDQEGLKALQDAAVRCGVEIFRPRSLMASVERKLEILLQRRADLLINIGGNHASLGGCRHAASLPTGLHRPFHLCDDPDRGLLVRASEAGIPVLHILNIRAMAVRYGIPIGERKFAGIPEELYTVRHANGAAVAVLFALIGTGVVLCGRSGKKKQALYGTSS